MEVCDVRLPWSLVLPTGCQVTELPDSSVEPEEFVAPDGGTHKCAIALPRLGTGGVCHCNVKTTSVVSGPGSVRCHTVAGDALPFRVVRLRIHDAQATVRARIGSGPCGAPRT